MAILSEFTDIRGDIGYSSFAVLTYSAVTNEDRPPRIVPIAVLIGCLVLASFTDRSFRVLFDPGDVSLARLSAGHSE